MGHTSTTSSLCRICGATGWSYTPSTRVPARPAPSRCRSDKHKSRRRAPRRRDQRSCAAHTTPPRNVCQRSSQVLASLFPARCCTSTPFRLIISPAAPEASREHDKAPLRLHQRLRCLVPGFAHFDPPLSGQKKGSPVQTAGTGVEDGRTRAHSARMACAWLLLGTRGVLSCASVPHARSVCS